MNALLYTLGVFGLILILARLKVPLAPAIILGAVVEGAVFGLGVGDIFYAGLDGACQPRTIALVVITVLLLALSYLMRVSGQFEEIVELAKQLFRRPSFAMASLPALVGLLPMPGGAVFSAPMVESAAGQQRAGGNVLSSINYWFRHIWEHWWPLYPGVILAMTLTGLPYLRFFSFQFPLGIFMVCSGLLLFRRTHPELHASSGERLKGTKRRFIKATSSIWIIIVVWVPAKYLVTLTIVEAMPEDAGSAVEKYLPLTIGLLASFVLTVYMKKPTREQLKGIFKNVSIYSMAALVISVMVFQYLLHEVGAAGKIADELLEAEVPVVVVVGGLPFIAGMVTGLAIGFVGTSFPIVLALAGAQGDVVYPYVVLAYGLGHLGQMMSPLHLCHVMSNEYFKTGFGAVYRRLLPTVSVNFVLISGYFLLLRSIS